MPYKCTKCEKGEKICKCDEPDFEFDDTPMAEDYTIQNEPEEKKEKAESPISKIMKYIAIIVPKIVISQDDNTKIIARIPVANYVENYEMGSKKFITFLKVKMHKNSNEIFGDDSYKAAAEMSAAIAVSDGSKTVPTFLRVAQTSDAIYYDCATTDKTAVKITANKVERIHLGLADPVFLNSARTAPQVTPTLSPTGKGLDKLLELLPIVKHQHLVFKCNFVALLLEKYPVPIIGLIKEHGAGKTTLTGTIKKIIDPQSDAIEDNTTKMAIGDVDRMVQMSKSYLLAYDNISYIKPNESDDISRAVTGTSSDKRSLFTNDEQTIVTIMRKFVFNGIGFLSDKGDFNSRTIHYTLHDLETIKTTEEFTKSLDEIIPEILADVFDILSKAMVIQPQVKDELAGNLTRMADFCVWGESIARVIGASNGEFMTDYATILDESNTKAAESHALVEYIFHIMEQIPEGKAAPPVALNPTIKEFYNSAKSWAISEEYDVTSQFSNFPKSPSKVRPYMDRIKGFLRTLGYNVNVGKRDFTQSENRGRVRITITRLAATK